MSIRLHDTLTGKKNLFTPIHPDEVRMYVCGPTVYNDLHIGNFRCFVVYDSLARFLESRGYRVRKVQNFTDVDDKTIKKANEEGVPLAEVTSRYIASYHRDAQSLNVVSQEEPLATDYIPGMIDHIGALIEKGHAYAAEGSVYFDVDSFEPYGQLSHQNPEDRLEGARVEPEPGKRNPRDFVLWKAAKPKEPWWESPWGPGRPGWHIECSVMSGHLLGTPFDIHGAGEDLIFPHNENEIAQTQALTGQPLANTWLHNGMLTLAGEKMSKSLGNIFTVSTLLETYDPGALRLFLLSAHYRTPLATDTSVLDSVQASYHRIMNVLRRLDGLREGRGEDQVPEGPEWGAFNEALDDDFNTADAMAALFDRVRRANTDADRKLTVEGAARHAATIRAMLGVLGVVEAREDEDGVDEEVLTLIAARDEARRLKDFSRADAIREELKNRGILVEDTPQGARWYRQ